MCTLTLYYKLELIVLLMYQ
uniref:Uncharacterized protein n=1 Tax=Arundo donax TaxID=35708 RepID=A0A0A9B4S7_ARUDO